MSKQRNFYYAWVDNEIVGANDLESFVQHQGCFVYTPWYKGDNWGRTQSVNSAIWWESQDIKDVPVAFRTALLLEGLL